MRFLLQQLLRIGRSSADHASLVGDLNEEYERLHATSPAAAARWYLRETMAALIYATRDLAYLGGALSEARQDVRYGVRQLTRQTGSTAVAVVTLALGLGVVTAIFSVIDATMLRPLPYPDPHQLVDILVDAPVMNGRTGKMSPSMEDVERLRESTDLFTTVAGWGTGPRELVAHPEPERLGILRVTHDYLPMHGVRPLLGRGIDRGDLDPSAPVVALISHALWQQRYGGRADVVNEFVKFDTGPVPIVGVLPAWFKPGVPVIQPLRLQGPLHAMRGSGRLSVQARLRDNVTPERAAEQLSAQFGIGVTVRSRVKEASTDARTTVAILGAAVALIVLIACVNVAGLLLARGAHRQSELAVRASLGASRVRLIRQMLTESLVLAVPATALGITLAWATLDVLVANLPVSAVDSPISLNPAVLGATIALLIPVTLLVGLVPALRLSRVQFSQTLARRNRNGAEALSTRGGQWLIAIEVALAVVMVTGAALMLRTVERINAVDLGFEPSGLITMQLLPLEGDAPAYANYYSGVLREVRSLPGVESAGLVDFMPLVVAFRFATVAGSAAPLPVNEYRYTAGYLDSINARVRAGRLPSDDEVSDRGGGVVISESAARQLFPDGTAVGREVTTQKPARRWPVMGVIADLRHEGPLPLDVRGDFTTQVFFPMETEALNVKAPMTLVVRPTPGASLTPDAVRQAASSVGPRVLIERVRTGDQLFGANIIETRQRTWLLGILGGLGFVMALAGIFGTTAYAVTRRTAEIGVRMAFGARPGQVVTTMVRDAALPIALGAGVGLGMAAFAMRSIESFLFQVTPTDPFTLVGVAVLLAIVGSLAAWIPAMRAARVDPITALRSH
jgi:putative ABC transport system permease protein